MDAGIGRDVAAGILQTVRHTSGFLFDARDLTLFLLLLSSQLLQLLIGERQGALGGLGGRTFLLLLRLLEGNIPLKLADLLLKRFLLTLEPLLLRGIVVRILGCCL